MLRRDRGGKFNKKPVIKFHTMNDDRKKHCTAYKTLWTGEIPKWKHRRLLMTLEQKDGELYQVNYVWCHMWKRACVCVCVSFGTAG